MSVPNGWFRYPDLKSRNFSKSVWIPLRASEDLRREKEFGQLGYVRETFACGTLAVPVEHRELGEKLRWMLPESASLTALPLWLLSLSTAALMTSEQMHLLRECGNTECRWLFVDTSKNHTRRWCDMKICGNRMKARRFKAQRKN